MIDKILLLIILNWFTLTYNYQISLNDPFLISRLTNIAYMNGDFEGNYFLQMENGTVIKYNPTFTVSQIIAYPAKIEKIRHCNTPLYFQVQNGSFFQSAGAYQTVIFNNFTSINFHDYTTYSVLSSYHFNDTVIFTVGYALNIPNAIATPQNIVVCKNSLKWIYQSQIYTIYNYSTILGNNITAVSAEYISNSSPGYSFVGLATFIYNFYLSTSNNKIYNFTISINLLFNETTQLFDYSSMNASYTLWKTLN